MSRRRPPTTAVDEMDLSTLMAEASLFPTSPRFDGSDYDPVFDQTRLTKGIKRVYDALFNGEWWTLRTLSNYTGVPEASCSAFVRHLRKPRFGSHVIEKRRKELGAGTWEYRLVLPSATLRGPYERRQER